MRWTEPAPAKPGTRCPNRLLIKFSTLAGCVTARPRLARAGTTNHADLDPVVSDGPQCLCRGQAGGADGGQQPGQGADDNSGGQAAGPGLGRDDGGLVVAAGVGGDSGGAGDDAGGAPGQGQQDGLGEELGADLAAGGAERPAQPDLGATLEDGDDHDVGDPDRADQQRDRAEAEEQGVEGALGVGLGGRAADGWETVTWPGFPGWPGRRAGCRRWW